MIAAVDWTVVISTAITGAVGIAGVAGTIIAARIAGNSARESARLSISAEAGRARFSDKRQVYARATGALLAASLEASAVVSPADKSPQTAAAFMAAADAVSELELIAPPAILELSDRVMTRLIDFRAGRSDYAAYGAAEKELFTSLRADLSQEAQKLREASSIRIAEAEAS
jgi:hypothetical protein